VDVEALKRQAAEQAASQVQSGMILGLGTGSTARLFVEAVGRRLREGALRDIGGVATSERTAEQARALGIPVTSLNDLAPRRPDLAVDGADEIAPDLALIKGMGGALLREKIVETAAQRFVVIADESKLVARLGARTPVPVEVVRFGWRTLLPHLEQLGARPELRPQQGSSDPFVTDEGHYILDCWFGEIADPAALDARIRGRAGVVETGLFVGMASEAIVAGQAGVWVMQRP
jgi:ribose 5-phosphate isomerase A